MQIYACWLRQEPFDGRDNVDGFAIDFDVSCRGERNQGELVAVKWACRLNEGLGFPTRNLFYVRFYRRRVAHKNNAFRCESHETTSQ